MGCLGQLCSFEYEYLLGALLGPYEMGKPKHCCHAVTGKIRIAFATPLLNLCLVDYSGALRERDRVGQVAVMDRQWIRVSDFASPLFTNPP